MPATRPKFASSSNRGNANSVAAALSDYPRSKFGYCLLRNSLSHDVRRECRDHHGLGHSLDPHYFAPARKSGYDSHSRLGDVESFGNESNQRRVRSAIDWRRREANSHQAVVHARNFRLAGARLNVDADGGGLGHGRIFRKYWVGSALAPAGISLVPLDADIASESTLLPGEPHGDPADRFLIA
jgi:hypothetical protein